MSLPYFPMFPADFEADTSHLTLAEDGAYNRLLRLCWLSPGCCVPDDPEWLARRLRVDAKTFAEVVAPVIAEFFKRRRGKLFNPRLTAIFAETSEKHKRRVEAGRKGGRPAKALAENEKTLSNAKAMPKQPEPEPEPDITTTTTATRARTRDAEIVSIPGGRAMDVDALHKALQERFHAYGGIPSAWVNPAAGIRIGQWLDHHGLTPGEVMRVAEAQLAHYGKPPGRPEWWDKPMADFAAAKASTPADASPRAGRQRAGQVDLAAIFSKLDKDGKI